MNESLIKVCLFAGLISFARRGPGSPTPGRSSQVLRSGVGLRGSGQRTPPCRGPGAALPEAVFAERDCKHTGEGWRQKVQEAHRGGPPYGAGRLFLRACNQEEAAGRRDAEAVRGGVKKEFLLKKYNIFCEKYVFF